MNHSSNSNNPTTHHSSTREPTTLHSPKTTTLPLLIEEVVDAVKEEAVEEAVAEEAEVADSHQASLAHVPTKIND